MADLAQDSTIGPYPYRIVRRLGQKQGNMADVYLAAVGDDPDESRNNLVVVKITRIDEAHGEFFKATLENEVERLRRLKHPGIVRLYPIQKAGLRNLPYMAQASLPGRPWFSVMEYLAGDSLANLLKEQNQLDIGVALEIARSLAATLDYLHNLDQVHLDIKPENILFREPLQPGREPEPVLIDFGIARTAGQSGLEAGTLQWSAPERVRFVRGDKPPELVVRPHPSMDVYALGMVLYMMLVGRLPFAERTRKGITTAILEGHPTAPSQYQRLIQRELDDLVLMALAADPSQRPTADEFARALEELSIRLGYRPRYGFLPPRPAAAPQAVTAGSGKGSKARIAAGALGAIVLVESLLLVARPGPPAISQGSSQTASPRVVAQATQPKSQATQPPSAPTAAPSRPPVATALPAAATPASGGAETPRTATPTPFKTSTPVPTNTPTAATATTANTSTPGTRTPSAGRTPTPASRSIALAGPANGATLKGAQVFSWKPAISLKPNEALEVVIYRAGQNQLNGAGLADPTTASSVNVDLDAVNRNPDHPLEPGVWQWGVNLVQLTPYRSLQPLAGGWQFTYVPQ